MTRKLIPAFLASLIALLMASQSHAVLYNVNRTVGSASVTGYIETDGTIGTLDDANIVDFSLLLDDGLFSLTISQANGGTHLISTGSAFPGPANGSPLVATGTELLFDFNSTGFAHFQLDPVDTGAPFWCLTGSASTSHCNGLTGYEIVKTNQRPDVFHFVPLTGELSVAQVPAPGTLALFGLGLMGIGFARRKRAD